MLEELELLIRLHPPVFTRQDAWQGGHCLGFIKMVLIIYD